MLYYIWAQELVRELLGWTRGLDVFSIQIDLVAWQIFWCGGPTLVVVPCHVIFGLG